MSLLTALENAINSIGSWIKAIFSNAEKIYDLLSEDEKKAAGYAYGVIAIANKYVNQVDLILPAIQKAYPGLSTDVLHGFIDIVLKDLNAVQSHVPLTLDEAISELAAYLKSKNGNTWKIISQGLGSLLAVLLSPETPIQKFTAVAELVYQAIVKPKVESIEGDPVPPDPTHPPKP
jgi:hypothetical protein